jgi:hypothetical protein
VSALLAERFATPAAHSLNLYFGPTLDSLAATAAFEEVDVLAGREGHADLQQTALVIASEQTHLLDYAEFVVPLAGFPLADEKGDEVKG